MIPRVDSQGHLGAGSPKFTANTVSATPSKPLNVAIVGGGQLCKQFLYFLTISDMPAPPVEIVGVCDLDFDAPGMIYARSQGIYTTTDFRALFRLKELELIMELTGSAQVADLIYQTKPPNVSMIDHKGATLLYDLLRMEMERARIERERQEYEQRQRKRIQGILNSLPYRIMVVNRDMTIDTVNQTFLEELGLTPEEVIGQPCYRVRHSLDKPCNHYGEPCYLEEGFQKDKDRKSSTLYKEYTDENGNQRFEVSTIAPIFDESGNLSQVLEISRDITERISLEREVEKAKTFFQNVIESTVDGIVVVDTKGKVLIFNEGMERLTGYSAEEIINTGHLSSFYDIETAKENMRKMRSNLYGPPGKLNPTSMTITTKSGKKIPVTLSASIITIDGKEVGSVGVFTDMREILEMRKELKQAHLQLVQSEKIASVGRMAAGVAHEINNPLSGILIYAELLKEALQNNPQHLKDIQEIIDQTLRCKKIVADLLEFSRQSIGKTSAFSVDQLVTKSLNLLVNQASFQDIDVITEIESDMPEMIGDFGQLQQVLTNLFINAADAMQGKGTLTVRARFDQKEKKFILQVADTGPGIPEHLRDKIFDIFFTTKPVGKGTGLGLSISQNIINLHGGNIRVDCPPEGGTVFHIELPLESEDTVAEEPLFVGISE
ncbi:MAG TPA: PAS domain-containing sensor histidine kinase [Desulfobacterales bacterium]|nr:PAS domain-containing sensor histidine kinase [Desulfobacterales bacterium]